MISLVRPAGFVSEGDVSGTFICVDDKMLLLRRVPTALNGGAWCMAAGKAEPDEQPVQTARREIVEETGLAIPFELLTPFATVFVVRPPAFGPVGRMFLFHMFIARLAREPVIELNPREHDRHGWFTAAQALELTLVESGKDCIELFRRASRGA